MGPIEQDTESYHRELEREAKRQEAIDKETMERCKNITASELHSCFQEIDYGAIDAGLIDKGFKVPFEKLPVEAYFSALVQEVKDLDWEAGKGNYIEFLLERIVFEQMRSLEVEPVWQDNES